jgi:hypothetical protein
MQAIHANLAFTRPEDLLERGDDGVGRAKSLDPSALHDDEAFALHSCVLNDCSSLDGPDIREHGFCHVDLSDVTGLSNVLARACSAGEISQEEAKIVRRLLRGVSLPLANGRRIRILFIAPEGFIMRRGGPNGLRITDSATAPGMNNHDAAVSVHADQDVHGTPVKQILRGAAPWLFRHNSPTAMNKRSPLFLLNLWIPLQQVTRPLVLMDKRTLDRRKHQLRYALPTDGFLDRSPERRINDMWTFLHHPEQKWYFTEETGLDRAYLFNTLSTPHGAVVLPGEDHAETLYLRLREARKFVAGGDSSALLNSLNAPIPDHESPRTKPLVDAIAALQRSLTEARERALELCTGTQRTDWDIEAESAMDRVVRKSIEMRVVGFLT